MIFMVFVFCFLHLPGNKGASDTKRVDQTPPFIIKKTGQSVDSEIKCSHSIASYTQILWYKQDEHKVLKFLGYLNLQSANPEKDLEGKISFDGDGRKQSSLTISSLSLSDSGVYFCAASLEGSGYEPSFGGGTKLTVLEKGREVTPPTNESVKVFGPSSFECRNLKDDERKKTLLCVVSGFYPDHVSVFWQVNGKNETKGVATDNAAQWTDSSTEFYRITSRLRVPADDWNNPKNEFTCIISFFSGTDTTHYQNSIRGVEAQTKGVMTRDNYLRITQSAKLSYGVFIIKSTIYGAFVALVVWKLQGSTGKQNH